MQKLVIAGAVVAALLSGCAMGPSKELSDCLQPNRRVLVEIGGTKERPLKKGQKKRGRPQSAMVKVLAQGNSAFDFQSAVLKAGGKKEIDRALRVVEKGTRRDKRPLKVSAVVVSGHSDKFEGGKDDTSLSTARAKAVVEYLVSKGVDKKLMFWEGKGAKEPVPVTKFCEDK